MSKKLKAAGFTSIEDDSDSWSISSEESMEDKPKKVGKKNQTDFFSKNKDAKSSQTQDEEDEFAYSRPSISHVKNVQKRMEMNDLLKRKVREEKKKRLEKRKRLEKELGPDAPPVKKQRTLDNTRDADDTMVMQDDEEVVEDQNTDEFAEFFNSDITPKIYITTSTNRCKKGETETMIFIKDLLKCFPNTHYFERKAMTTEQIIAKAKEENFTDVMIINEDHKIPNAILMSHLPNGPTAMFRLTSIVPTKKILNRAKESDHNPEIILNNFNTRLGHTVARMFTALLPKRPEFVGRRVITFHNQRDFIFFRQHRYIYEKNGKEVGARLQEIGPRFTLKLRYLQRGTFDVKVPEYEWVRKSEDTKSRRRFFL